MASVVKNIFKLKCPSCNKGDLFTASGLNFSKLGKMPDQCVVCGQDFKIEVGFYWGALYVAYALSVATSLPQFFFYFIILDLSLNWSFTILIIVQLLLTPYLYRLSKSLWIHMFVPFGRRRNI